MIRYSLNLSPRHRLHLQVVKTRPTPLVSQDGPLIPSISMIKRFRSGNLFSRFFRHIFEHNKINRVLGTNLAIAVIASSVIKTPTLANSEISFEDTPMVIFKADEANLTTEKGIHYPVEKIKINQGYQFFHPGIDLEGESGDPVHPIMGGKVEAIQHSRFAYGNAVIVNHGNDITSLYAHLSKIEVNEGDSVEMDSIIGKVGSTGRSTGSHLHLEIREGTKTVNPISILGKK